MDDTPTAVDVREGSNLIAVAVKQRRIAFYDANTGAPTDKVIEIPFIVRSLRYSPSGDHLLVAGEKSEVSLINVRTKQFVFDQPAQRDRIIDVLWLSDDKWVAVSESGEVTVGDKTTIQNRHAIGNKIRWVCKQRNGNWIAIVSDLGETIMYDVVSGLKQTLPKPADAIRAYASALLPNDEVLTAVELSHGFHELTARSWSGVVNQFYGRSRSTIVTAVDVLAGNKAIVFGNNIGDCWYWGTDKGSRPVLLASDTLTKVSSIAVSPTGQHCVFAGFGAKQLGILDLSTLEIRWINVPGVDAIRTIDYLSPQHLVLIDEVSGDVVALDVSGTVVNTWKHNARALSVRDASSFFCISDSAIILQNLESSKCIDQVPMRNIGTVISSVYRDDTDQLVVESASGSTVVVSFTGTASSTQPARYGVMTLRHVPSSCIVRHPFGLALIAGLDGMLRLAQKQTQSELALADVCKLNGRPASVVVSADSRFIVAGMQDGTLAVISTEGHKLLLAMHADTQGWVAVSPDGTYDGDNAVHSAVHLVLGRESRSLEQLPVTYKRPNLVSSVVSSNQQTPVVAQSVLLRDVAMRPASVRFVRETLQQGTTSNCQLPIAMDPNGAVVTCVTVSQGTHIVHRQKSDEKYGLQSFQQVVSSELLPGDNHFVIRALMRDGRISSDTLTLTYHRNGPTKQVERAVELAENPPGVQPQADKNDASIHALIIGIDAITNQSGMPGPASASVADLSSTIKEMYRSSTVEVLTNDAASAEQIVTKIKSLAEALKPEDNVMIVFTGKTELRQMLTGGSQRYIIPYSAVTAQVVGDEALALTEMMEAIANLNAHSAIVVLDVSQDKTLAGYEDDFHDLRTIAHDYERVAMVATISGPEVAMNVNQHSRPLLLDIVQSGLLGAASNRSGDISGVSLVNYIAKTFPIRCQQNSIQQQLFSRIGIAGSELVLKKVH
jgi:WD40 repeat protein